jgi:HrpA-like RNA helicase
MGLNIIKMIDNKEYKSDNYYIQYKHNKDNHIKNNTNHLTLKMVTDGTLLEELITSPLLKNKIMGKYEDNNQSFIFDLENMYDIVIVDEAHEHNPNMDLILTLMRDTTQLNNSLRLVIISATIDDDEPRYRRYYKHIDDIYFPKNYN